MEIKINKNGLCIAMHELEKALSLAKNKKAPGPNKVPAKGKNAIKSLQLYIYIFQ